MGFSKLRVRSEKDLLKAVLLAWVPESAPRAVTNPTCAYLFPKDSERPLTSFGSGD